MNNETLISDILDQVYRETGIVLKRQTDRDRIARYLEGGGPVPRSGAPLPLDLIRLVTTNETYFEREKHHFDYLMDEILPRLDAQEPHRPLRILCAPCSSGEEPYTIALRIEAATRRFSRPIEIVGIDISDEMVKKAEEGLYSARSVHDVPAAVLESYFSAEGSGAYRIRPMHRSSVRFLQGNVFDSWMWERLGNFDVIFSRNMMIYFDNEKNRELMERFRKHLRGYLILGHADDHRQAKELFTPLPTARGMVYRL